MKLIIISKMEGDRNTSKITFINLGREKRRPEESSTQPSFGVMKFIGHIPISILDRLEGSEYAKKRHKQLKEIRTIFEGKEDEKPGPNVIFLYTPPEDPT